MSESQPCEHEWRRTIRNGYTVRIICDLCGKTPADTMAEWPVASPAQPGTAAPLGCGCIHKGPCRESECGHHQWQDDQRTLLTATEGVHRRRWPGEGPTYDPAKDFECQGIVIAVRAALTPPPLDVHVIAELRQRPEFRFAATSDDFAAEYQRLATIPEVAPAP